jgi:hypothetical protein
MVEILGRASPEEARAVWAALSQYVENGLCDDGVEVEGAYARDPHLLPAELLLARLDCALAEGAT